MCAVGYREALMHVAARLAGRCQTDGPAAVEEALTAPAGATSGRPATVLLRTAQLPLSIYTGAPDGRLN